MCIQCAGNRILRDILHNRIPLHDLQIGRPAGDLLHDHFLGNLAYKALLPR